MVRSKSEDENHLFHLAEKFRSADKYIDVSLAGIERQLDANGGESEHRSIVEVDEDGTARATEIRININCRSSVWLNWSVSVKLHRKKRIDCIDHEFSFPMGSGSFGQGWHRHTWDTKAEDCENKKFGKQPLPNFGTSVWNRTSFLRRAFEELGISLNKRDDGNDELPIS